MLPLPRYSFLPIESLLALLWDIAEDKHRRRLIKVLRDRSLIKTQYDEYYLHPVIREAALSRLKTNNQEWRLANIQSAIFWEKSVNEIITASDVVKALEAYYYYFEIGEFEQACNVLLKKRDSPWKEGERLTTSFYRLGLLTRITDLIVNVIDHIQPNPSLGTLYNTLSSIYWLRDNITNSLVFCDRAQEIASQFSLSNLMVMCLQNKGICKIAQWDLESAIQLFQASALLEGDNCSCEYSATSLSCLAFLQHHLGSNNKVCQLADKAYKRIFQSTRPTTVYCSIYLALTYKALGETEKFLMILHRNISYCEESNHIQVKAKSLVSLSSFYAESKNFTQALSKNLEALEILDRIGAKGDLAEAYLQLALTYKAMGEVVKSIEFRDIAISLFTDMQTPKQITRVEQMFDSKT